MKDSHAGQTYTIADKKIVCPHCGGDRFVSREILLNTRGATFFNFDWLNKASVTLTCTRCSRIEWFNDSPKAS